MDKVEDDITEFDARPVRLTGLEFHGNLMKAVVPQLLGKKVEMRSMNTLQHCSRCRNRVRPTPSRVTAQLPLFGNMASYAHILNGHS